MDKIIDRLSDIEKAAGSLMDDAGVRKKALAKNQIWTGWYAETSGMLFSWENDD